MPELPEVEYAASVARRVAQGRIITSITVLHRAQRRSLSRRAARSLAGERVLRVERRGKTQLFRLTSGRVLVVHFRMTGDWLVPGAGQPLPAHARAVIDFDEGSRLVLDDPRALSLVAVHDSDARVVSGLGPEPDDHRFNARALAATLAGRRSSVKAALLDQRVVAGVGNIYAAESLWRARIDPRTPAGTLGTPRLARLVRAVRAVIAKAMRYHERYYGAAERSGPPRFDVYDREGKPCRRCGSKIQRIVQAGRSTYFCRRCQR